MDPSYLNFLHSGQAQRIAQALGEQQYIRPHRPVREAIEQAGAALGFCPEAAVRALHTLEIDPARSMGRLRRSELAQLAQAITRFWQQTQPQPVA